MTRIYTSDLETDPFLEGRKPEPFLSGVYDGERFVNFWGDDCVDRLLDYLETLEPGIVYFHNGGKFDLFYLLHRIIREKSILIIHERITQCHVKAKGGFHRVRDSLKILPFALKQYKKDEIDYRLFESDLRDDHRDQITSYFEGDLKYLYELVSEYVATFGPAITIGSTAIKELKAKHDIGELWTADLDGGKSPDGFRSRYYLGARVERYKTGVFEGDWKVYDVNSMYPYVMGNFYHPVGTPYYRGAEITDDTFFITARGVNRGAFATRTKTGVSFSEQYGVFSTTIHEWRAAEELGLFDCEEIIETVDFDMSRCFVDYIDHFYNLRKHARLSGDKIKEIFYKYLLNNSYGKFAVNPDNFKEYQLTDDQTDMRFMGFEMAEAIPDFNLILWEKPSEEAKYVNVATGASITGAARSLLMRGLASSVNPIYCDTDSIICESLQADIDEARLGAWKLEKTGNLLAVAGRKMYALFDGATCVKKASKGVNISPEQIRLVAQGEIVTYVRDAPTYKLHGGVEWLTRRVRTV